MKIRKGFVSNSSSSSFHLYGTVMEECEFKELIVEKKITDEEEIEKYGLSEVIYNIDIPGLQILYIYDNEAVYIGRYYSSIGDNETGKEFKESTEMSLRNFIGQNIDCEEHEGVNYN